MTNEYDNVTNDPFLDEYYKIKRGLGRPEIIDKMMNEVIRQYDMKGNLIYFKNLNGFEEWNKYDSM
ncbi:MAG: hypothetical protein EBX71_08730, partial [Betaproteobacteria bacterium]|nr:hypothetical protein [Betaproteobacteria bacterium]